MGKGGVSHISIGIGLGEGCLEIHEVFRCYTSISIDWHSFELVEGVQIDRHLGCLLGRFC